jgi:hypothetical protein
MTGPLLESGTLTEFEPLGAGGETLFSSASELRVAVQRRLGAGVAACLAVPQQNAYADTLDWYAPQPGPVTPWATLSDEQRSAVLEHVEALRGQLLELSRQLVQEDRRDRQIFGRLLEHAATIPDSSHIFLVGDQPVLAFWGFRLRGKDSISDVPSGSKSSLVGRDGGKKRDDKKPNPELDSSLPRDASAQPRVGARRLWWLLAAAVIATLIFGILWHRMTPPSPPVEGPQTPADPITQAPTAGTPPEPLVFPPDAIETGSTDFLTGRWQASSDDLVDSDTKRPISLAFDLDQGAGDVTITEQSGAVCRAPVDAAFDGETLTLTPRGAIPCPNRAPFYGVTVTCRPSTDRRAVCTGSFPNGKVFRVDLGRHQ